MRKCDGQPSVAGAMKDHLEPEVREVGGACHFHDQKCVGRSGQNRGQAERRGARMDGAARSDSKHGDDTGPSALRDASTEDVEGVLSRRQVEKNPGGNEEQQILRAKHVRELGADRLQELCQTAHKNCGMHFACGVEVAVHTEVKAQVAAAKPHAAARCEIRRFGFLDQPEDVNHT
jgi:hypothetical protein